MMRSILSFRLLHALLVWSMLTVCVPAAAQTTANPWTPAANAAILRMQHTATLLPSGKVLLAGGSAFPGSLASAEIYDPASNTFSTAASLKTSRYYHTATLLPSGKVLVAGGVSDEGGGIILASAELYDPTSNTWTAAGTLAEGHANHTATLLLSGKVLVVGGDGNGNGNAEVYDPASNSWSAAGFLSTPRRFSTATLLPSGKVLVAGGYVSSFGYLTASEIYDPGSNSWSVAASLSVARGSHTATLLLSGKVLVAGGFNATGSDATATAELYDPGSNTWSPASSFTARYYHTATMLPSGKVLVAGGGNSGTPFLAKAELYDPTTNTWSNTLDGTAFAAGNLIDARIYHTATLLPSGKVFVAGGLDNARALVNAEQYDTARTDTRPPPIYGASSWNAAGNLGIAHAGHSASLLSSGKVLVAGGISGGSVVASAELYDIASNTFGTAASLITARANHTATVLASGKVLVAGGFSSGPIASCELYDPVSNTWSAAGSLATARGFHTATLLASGKVLVTGGGGAGLFASAELYDPATNAWTPAASMALAREHHSATLLSSGKVLAVGGDDSSSAFASAELYDPASNSWGAAGSLATARFSHSATLMSSGKVLAAGGGGNSGVLASTEIYDPVSNSWSAAANLATTHIGHTGTLLQTDRVLIAAGSNGNTSAELYDAATNTWYGASNLATGRASHTATVLPSGKVLVAGGSNSSGTPIASAELYTLDFAIPASRRPVITGTNNLLIPGDTLQVTGTGFNGDSDTSSGSTNSSATNSPLLQLRRLDNAQIVWSSPATNSSRSATSYQSAPLSSMPVGPYLLTMFVDAVPSASVIITIDSTHNVLSFSSGNGTISPSTTQVVKDGTTTAFTLTPAPNYHIASVTGTCGGNLVGNIFTTLAITGDCAVVANFAINTHTLTYTAAANGTISGTSPQTVNHGANGTAVTAVPNTGYHFVQWSDASIANPRTDTNVTANISVTASFAINTYTLTYAAAANGTLSGTSPQTVNHGASGTAVTAVANTGYHFVQWSDASTANPRTDTNVTASLSVTASFAIDTYALTYAAGANGTISGTPAQIVNYGASGSAVTAIPSAGYHFVQWSDASTANPRTDTNVTADISVTASFAINVYTVTSIGGSNGSIAPPTQNVNHGDAAIFTITPNAGYSTNISGDTCSVSHTSGTLWTSNAIAADCVVTASFVANPAPALAITLTDTGDYARAGKLLNYIVTVSNTGSADAAGVTLSSTLPAQIDGAYATWICIGAGNGAACASSGSGDLNTGSIVIPAGRTLVWQVTAAVLPDAVGDTVDYTVTASLTGIANVSATDSDMMVIFRNTFDVPYADGTRGIE